MKHVYKGTIFGCLIYYHDIECILFIENYDQSLGKEERRKLILIKEDAPKEFLDSKKMLKTEVLLENE